MPNRIIRETICTSENVNQISWFEEVLFYRLIVNCDDFGRYDGRAAIIKNRLFPLKENLTLKTVENALHGLARAGLVALYMVQGKRFLYLPTWGKYQYQRAKESKFPPPEEDSLQESESAYEHLQANDSKCLHLQANVPVIENRESRYEIRDSRSEIRESKSGYTPPNNPPASGGPRDVFAEFAGENADLLAALRDYSAMRIKLKKPMTDRAKQLAIGKLRELSGEDPAEMIRILEQSIANSWQGLFPLRDAQQAQKPWKQKNAARDAEPDRLDPLVMKAIQRAVNGGNADGNA